MLTNISSREICERRISEIEHMNCNMEINERGLRSECNIFLRDLSLRCGAVAIL